HLELCMRRSHASTIRKKRVSMHLLYSNQKMVDIIDGLEIEDYVISSRGMLTVTYMLTEPSDDWTGLVGKIDQNKIEYWLYSNIAANNNRNIEETSNYYNNNNNSSNYYNSNNNNSNNYYNNSNITPQNL